MVMGNNSCLRGCGFESRHHILDGHFFALICCKNCIVSLKRPKLTKKGLSFFKKKHDHRTLTLDGEVLELISCI